MKQHELKFSEGKVSFFLPDRWVAESEDKELTMYYDPREGSGTLRVQVVTAKGTSQREATLENFKDSYEKKAQKDSGRFEQLENGNLLVSHNKNSTEQGQNIVLFHWLLGVLAPPFLFNCSFSFTTLERQRNDEATRSELEMLEKSVRSAEVILRKRFLGLL